MTTFALCLSSTWMVWAVLGSITRILEWHPWAMSPCQPLRRMEARQNGEGRGKKQMEGKWNGLWVRYWYDAKDNIKFRLWILDVMNLNLCFQSAWHLCAPSLKDTALLENCVCILISTLSTPRLNRTYLLSVHVQDLHAYLAGAHPDCTKSQLDATTNFRTPEDHKAELSVLMKEAACEK